MPGLIIGTTFLYDYTKNNKGRLIIVASQHEIDSNVNEETARTKVQHSLMQTLQSYLTNIELSEEEKQVIADGIKLDILEDLKEKEPTRTREELQTVLLDEEFKLQIQEATDQEVLNEKDRIQSTLMSLPNQYTLLNRIDFKSDLIFGNKTYNAQIQARLSKCIDQIKNVIEELVRFNHDSSKTKTTPTINEAIASEFANISQVIFISPCNLGYPHESNEKALILQEAKALHNIMKPLRESKPDDLLVKCIWTTHDWNDQDRNTLEKAKEAFEASERKERTPLSQTNQYRKENHFCSPRQVDVILKNPDQWWKEGLVSELRVKHDTTQPLADSAQSKFTQLKTRATQIIGNFGLKKSKIYIAGSSEDSRDLNKKVSPDDETVATAASSNASSVVKNNNKKNKIQPTETEEESTSAFTRLPS